MFTYYTDESYDSKTFCVGGWLYHDDLWKVVEKKWSDRIEYERRRSIKRGETPISRFHAADCSNRRGEFDGWPVDRQKLFFKKLVGIICSSAPTAVAWASSFEDLRSFFPNYKQKTAQRVLYYLCFQKCLRDVLSIMRENYPSERVAVIHDDGFNGTAQAAFNLVRRKFDQNRVIVTVAPMRWQDCTLLQPADMIAYEGSKVCFRYRNNIPQMRRSFQKILGAKLGLSVGYVNQTTFEQAKYPKSQTPEDGRMESYDANEKDEAAQ
ncbi:MAG TPA: hypothetical protein VNK23_11190 [Candidatus Dormibacteraeota bacterium]|nr:hypothetical protein [Candidatus Dormibacteraeota bacterium]